MSGESAADRYRGLLAQAKALMAGESDRIANAANLSALAYAALDDVNWVGFYFMNKGELVVGPFQGLPACVRIPVGRGVCGRAVAEDKTIVVADVLQFEGHIACDAATRSEIVVPLHCDGQVIGVLDIDSPIENRFDVSDRQGIEALAGAFEEAIS